jgi:hypothetical protein
LAHLRIAAPSILLMSRGIEPQKWYPLLLIPL